MTFDLSQIDPVAFSVGPLVVRWYALAYLAGFVLGWRYCVYLVRQKGFDKPNAEHIDDFLTWAVIGVILGGRIGYVLFYNFDYYIDHLVEIPKVWKGGMSFHGGVLGVIAAMIGFSVYKKIPLLRLSDLICAAAPIGLFFGRIANFINGELYGRVTSHSFGMVFPHGGDLPRHPSQLYEAFSEGLLLFLILFALTKLRVKAGVLSGVFLCGYGLFRAMIEFVREPDAQIGLIGGAISMGQILCMPMIFGGLLLILLSYKGRFDDPQPA